MTPCCPRTHPPPPRTLLQLQSWYSRRSLRLLCWEAPKMGWGAELGLDWAGLPVIATVARVLCRELTLQNEYLRLENGGSLSASAGSRASRAARGAWSRLCHPLRSGIAPLHDPLCRGRTGLHVDDQLAVAKTDPAWRRLPRDGEVRVYDVDVRLQIDVAGDGEDHHARPLGAVALGPREGGNAHVPLAGIGEAAHAHQQPRRRHPRCGSHNLLDAYDVSPLPR